MENKKTTELLDLLQKLNEDDFAEGGKYEQITKELYSRYPFVEILDEDFTRSLPAVWEEIEELKAEIKRLKRHKHDEKTGDVLIRI